MSLKHHVTGSPYPPLVNGKLRIYSMHFCPFAQRTRLVLAHLKIPNEVINCNLKRKPEWLLERNPLGLVPVLEKDGKIIYESSICDDYLDEVYGKNKLLSNDAYEKAQQKILMEKFSKVTGSFYGLLRQTDEERKQTFETLWKALDVFEHSLPGIFIGGSEPNMVDFHIWPWMERFPILQRVTTTDPLPKDRFPKLNSWVAAMKELPAVKESYLTPETHWAFVESGFLAGKEPNYDFGLE